MAVVVQQCLFKILSFFFFFFSFLLRFFDLEFVGDPVIVIWAGICCSLWRLICRCHCHWWFVEVDCDCSLMCWNLFNIIYCVGNIILMYRIEV